MDETGAFDWLLGKVNVLKPEFLVGLGDWGRAWIKTQWDELASLCHLSIIYGNHEKLDLLKRPRNLDGSRILVQDGETRRIASLRFGFINGIVSDTRRSKQGIPRKTTEGYLKAGSKLDGVDVLCTHESPYLEEYGGRIHESPGTKVIGEVIKKVKPKLALSGHLAGPYSLGRLGETSCLRIDSSPSEKHFAILEGKTRRVLIYNDWTVVRELIPGFNTTSV